MEAIKITEIKGTDKVMQGKQTVWSVSATGYISMNDRMIMNDALGRTWNKVAMAYLKTLV